MSTNATTFTADASLTVLCIAKTSPNATEYKASIQMGGTFGGGTLSLFISLDGGTTKNTLDDSGTPYTTTSAKSIKISVPCDFAASSTGKVIIYGTLAGSTSPSLVTTIIDNN